MSAHRCTRKAYAWRHHHSQFEIKCMHLHSYGDAVIRQGPRYDQVLDHNVAHAQNFCEESSGKKGVIRLVVILLILHATCMMIVPFRACGIRFLRIACAWIMEGVAYHLKCAQKAQARACKPTLT
eukprot:6195647-Pleurochrysis_carterae.AAC.3